MSDSVPRNHPIDEEHDGNYPIDEANDVNTAQQEPVLDQHPSLVLGNDNSIMEVVQKTSTLLLSTERSFQHRNTTSTTQVTTKVGKENASQSKPNAQLPPSSIMPNTGRDSVYQDTTSSTPKNVSVPREALVRNGRYSQQKVFVRGREGSIPRAARFQADASQKGIRTSTRATSKLAVKGDVGPPPSSNRPVSRGGSALVGRVTPHRYPERIIQGTAPVLQNSEEGCSSAATPDIVNNSGNNIAGPSKKQQQGGDRDKSALALAISEPITVTVPHKRRLLLIHTVFLSLNKIWHDTCVKLGPSRGRRLLSMRFSHWGRVYFSSVVHEVRADEEEDVMTLLNNVFCVIAQRLGRRLGIYSIFDCLANAFRAAECMKLVGMEKGGADWSVIDAFLEEAEEDEMEVGNDKEISQEIEDQSNTENGEGNEQAGGGGAKKDQADEKDEKNEGLREVEKRLNPFFESLKG